MKSRLFAAIAAVMALAFSSCQKEDPIGDPNLELSTTCIQFTKEGGSQTIVLKSTLDWALKDYTDDVKAWLVIDPSSGKASNGETTITVKASANTGINREVSITFFGNVLHKQTLVISQPGEKGDTETLTVAEFLAKKDTQNAYNLRGKIGNISKSNTYYGFSLKDDTGEISCPFPKNWDEYSSQLSTGGEVTINGKYEFYTEKSQDQLADGVISSYVTPTGTTIETVTVAKFLEKADAYNVYRLEGKVASAVNATYCSFDLKDATGTVKVYTVNNASEWGSKVKQGGTVTLRGAYALYTKGTVSTPEVVDAWIEKFEEAPVSPTVDVTTIAEIRALESQTKVNVKEMLVVLTNAKAYLLSDGNDYIFAYKNETPTVKVGDKVSLSATVVEYPSGSGCVQLSTITDEKVLSSGNEVKLPEPEDVTSKFDTFATKTGKYIKHVKFTGLLTISGNYYNIAVDGATKIGSIAYPSQNLSAYDGKTCVFTGFYLYLTSSDKYVNIMLTSIRNEGHYLSASPAQISVDYKATSAKFKVLSDQQWNLSVPSGVKAEPTSGNSDTEVTLTFDANSEYSEKTHKLELTASGMQTVEVTLTQGAAPDPSAKFVELTNAEIVKTLSDLNTTSTTYTDVTYISASGSWKSSSSPSKTNKWVQIRSTKASYLSSPVFDSEIEKIEIRTDANKSKPIRTFYAVDPSTKLESSDTGYDALASMKTVLENCYGKVQTKGLSTTGTAGEVGETVTITFGASTKSFMLLTTAEGSGSATGASYINSIKVYLKK